MKITCYFNDENISATRITCDNGSVYWRYYGDEYLEIADVGSSVEFLAFPKSGSNFAQWVYRIGSTTGSVLYSYSNPFTYNGSLQAFVRAEGESTIVVPTRPDYFYWTYSKTSGSDFYLTAAEWNELTSNINAVREYCGYLQYGFTTAYRGNPFTAAMYNQAVNAIKGISGYGYYLSTVSKGDPVTAYDLNNLVSELNAIS